MVEGADQGAAITGAGVDTELVRSAIQGDERAFTEIVNSLADRFLAVALRICGTRPLPRMPCSRPS